MAGSILPLVFSANQKAFFQNSAKGWPAERQQEASRHAVPRDCTMPADEPPSREAWLHRAVLAGDEHAWRELYDAAFRPLAAYVHWRCGGRTDRAEEIVQETWLTAVRRIRDYDPHHAAFLSWLRGIAANVLRNHFRSMNGHIAQAQPITNDIPQQGGPEAGVEQREQANRIAQALLALPDHYETVLRAKYVDQMSVAEIAHTRNETSKATESLLTRARQAFREAYLKLEH